MDRVVNLSSINLENDLTRSHYFIFDKNDMPESTAAYNIIPLKKKFLIKARRGESVDQSLLITTEDFHSFFLFHSFKFLNVSFTNYDKWKDQIHTYFNKKIPINYSNKSELIDAKLYFDLDFEQFDKLPKFDILTFCSYLESLFNTAHASTLFPNCLYYINIRWCAAQAYYDPTTVTPTLYDLLIFEWISNLLQVC